MRFRHPDLGQVRHRGAIRQRTDIAYKVAVLLRKGEPRSPVQQGFRMAGVVAGSPTQLREQRGESGRISGLERVMEVVGYERHSEAQRESAR